MLDWLLPAAALALVAAVVLAIGVRTYRGVARLRAANRQLERRVGELSAATSARTRFLAMMSHEIRTPLTGIVGFAEVLADEPLSAAGRRSLDGIRRSSRALQALLGDILDFSRIDAGALQMQPRPTDLEALLGEVRDEFAPRARQRGLGFGLSVAESARRWVETDALRLRQVIVNLVSNAIRYTEAGAVRVTAAADSDDAGVIVIAVVDTGLGISAEDRDRIFDAFAQASAGGSGRSEDGGGVGLGLAIAGGLARAMGGSIALDSTLGQGSTFTVRLPLPACAPAVSAAEPQPARDCAPRRILLVDDVAMNRELFAAMLSRDGHAVTLAEDGEAALRCLDAGGFDLAFIDIQMPFMDGLELTRRIRTAADPRVAALPIIALSAAAYGEDRERAEAAGMNGYVTKPATRDDMAEAIARVADPAAAVAPRTTAAVTPPVLDRRTLDDQRATFGDQRLRRFLALLREELARRRAALAAAAAAGDRGALALHAHATASAAGNLGFAALLALGRRLEVEFPQIPDEGIPIALEGLHSAIDDAVAVIGTLEAELSGEGSRLAG